MTKKTKRLLCRALLAVYAVGAMLAAASLALATTIEGQTPSGAYQTVSVTSNGQLNVAPGGPNGTPTCSKIAFSTVQLSSGALSQILLASNTAASQTVFYVEGPDDLYTSTQTLVNVYPRAGSLWAHWPAGSYFTLDSPASVIGPTIYGEAVGSSTYTLVSVTTCTN